MATERKIDPVLVAVLSNRIKAIAEEMAKTLMMTSRSGIFAEARDFVTAVFDKELRLIAQSEYFPGFAGALPYILPPLVKKFEENIHEGDIFMVNDPYEGNSHIPDLNIVKPVFYEGKVQFWTACKGHMADIGAGGVAGYDPEGTTVWDEGLVIPPIKLYDKGKRSEALWDFILRNVKARDIVAGDIMCEVGGNNIGERGLLKLLDRYGPETIHLHIDEFLSASEREVRDRISRIPDGVYYGEKSVDDNIEDKSKPVTIRVKVTKEGSDVTIDFSDSDPQGPRFMNSSFAFTQSMGTLTIFWIIEQSKSNYGSLKAIHFINPVGTCVNCAFPATATLATTSMAEGIQEAIQLALAPAVRHLVAAGSSKLGFQIVRGINPRTGRLYVNMDFFCRGTPSSGTEGYDGWEGGGPAQELGMGRVPDVEIQELISPVHILTFEEEMDSAGAGMFRGGNGHIYRVQYLADTIDGVLSPCNGTREYSVPFGLFGGKNPKPNITIIERPDSRRDKIESNSFMNIKKGNIVTSHLMGGAGFGDPFERDTWRVQQDVRDGFVSVEKAREEYGVVLDPETFEIDADATAKLRKRHNQ